jgi:predicted amidophosphoribosyltransferase
METINEAICFLCEMPTTNTGTHPICDKCDAETDYECPRCDGDHRPGECLWEALETEEELDEDEKWAKLKAWLDSLPEKGYTRAMVRIKEIMEEIEAKE